MLSYPGVASSRKQKQDAFDFLAANHAKMSYREREACQSKRDNVNVTLDNTPASAIPFNPKPTEPVETESSTSFYMPEDGCRFLEYSIALCATSVHSTNFHSYM